MVSNGMRYCVIVGTILNIVIYQRYKYSFSVRVVVLYGTDNNGRFITRTSTKEYRRAGYGPRRTNEM